jgi:WD40 repeat protein
MRLLSVHSLEFRTFSSADIEPYVIASHRWHDGEEASIKDVRKKNNAHKSGYQKVEGFARYVRETVNVDWIWIDTCCINQESSQEVSEAVNSMFKWYRNAEVCLAYLADVETTDNMQEFCNSSWFRRGWTLQELLAPQLVLFLTRSWQVIGHKGTGANQNHLIGSPTGPLLNDVIAAVTGIPRDVLADFQQSRSLSIEDRLAWTAGRNTTREEDLSYCLYGIFGVTMPVIYGEGSESARARLLVEIHLRKPSYEVPVLHHKPQPSGSDPAQPTRAAVNISNDNVEEGEFTRTLLEAAIASGEDSYEKAEWKAAHAMFQEAVEISKVLVQENVESALLANVYLKLGVSAFHLDEMSNAESALNAFIKHSHSCGAEPLAHYQAEHILSLACVKQGNLGSAIVHCKNAYTGRKDSLGKDHHACFESLALMARIFELQNNEQRATLVSNMIPKELQESSYRLYNTLRAWNKVKQFREVSYGTISPRGDFLAAPMDNAVGIWDIASGLFVRTITFGRSTYMGAPDNSFGLSSKAADTTLEPNGRLLAARNYYNDIWLMDCTTRTVVKHFYGRKPEFSPNGELLAIELGCRGPNYSAKGFDIYSTATWKRVWSTERSGYGLCVFSPDSNIVAAYNRDGRITLFRSSDGHEIKSFIGDRLYPYNLLFSPDGGLLAAMTILGLCIWDLATGQDIATWHSWNEVGGSRVAITFSPHGQLLSSNEHISTIQCLDVRSGVVIKDIWPESQTKMPRRLMFSVDGTLLLTGSEDGTCIWEWDKL